MKVHENTFYSTTLWGKIIKLISNFLFSFFFAKHVCVNSCEKIFSSQINLSKSKWK